MKEIYDELLKKSLEYYKIGRPMDIERIKWLLETVPRYISNEELDYKIPLPLVILHNVGYSRVPKNSNSYNLDIRTLHSE